MKYTAEKIDNHQIRFEIEVPQPEVAKAVEKAVQKLAGKVNIPGFRKGKVPRKVLEMRIGKQALLDEAFEIIAGPAYSKALQDEKVEPVTRPEIEVITLEEDKNLMFKATFVKKPEVEIGEYKGLKAAYANVEIADEEVTKEIDTLRERNAKMVVVEGAELNKGDFAIIDFEGFIDGEAFKGGEAKAYPLEIGSGSFIPGFEEQLIGAKAGEERTVKVMFPEEYFVPELKGKEAEFKVTIHDVKRKEMPELNDEFAKTTGQAETLEELKTSIKNKLEQTAKEKAEHEYRNEIIKKAVEAATIDIPEIMIKERLDHMVEDFDMSLQNRGMKLDAYFEYAKTDMEGLRASYRETAINNVKTDLVLEEVAKLEKIEVKPVDLDAEIYAVAQGFGADPKDVRDIIVKQGRVNALADNVLRKKAAQFIIENADKQ